MGFAGAWRVREYVFDAAGRLLGTVRQRRILEPLGAGRLRLIQHCSPDPTLADHPMARFAGEHVFDLQIDGTRRRYLGPAVIGVGQTLGEGAMWGEGIWPHFGHAFQSYAVSYPEKQLTGGRFTSGSSLIAQIVGIARPETSEASWPELSGPHEPRAIAQRWTGSCTRVLAGGEPQWVRPMSRVYQDDGWTDLIDGQPRQLHHEQRDSRCHLTVNEGEDTLCGLSRRYGWQLELEWVHPSGRHTRGFEVLDAADAQLLAISRCSTDQQLTHVDVLRLTPEASP